LGRHRQRDPAVGARPVFVDIEPATRLIDPGLIEAAITERTEQSFPWIWLACQSTGTACMTSPSGALRVIEDAAQSQGANWKGRELGCIGDLVAFSFHPNKNMTTGEGGCLG